MSPPSIGHAFNCQLSDPKLLSAAETLALVFRRRHVHVTVAINQVSPHDITRACSHQSRPKDGSIHIRCRMAKCKLRIVLLPSLATIFRRRSIDLRSTIPQIEPSAKHRIRHCQSRGRASPSRADLCFIVYFGVLLHDSPPSGECHASTLPLSWLMAVMTTRSSVATIRGPRRIPNANFGTWPTFVGE